MITDKKFNDVRDLTYMSRKKIGFLSDYHLWKDEPALFTDEDLVIQGHPVMERWEENYMSELAKIVAKRGGDILEVGFGMGISAEFIQSHPIDHHFIIEANSDVFNALLQFSKESAYPVTPLFGFWQEVTKTLPDESFSGILFDTYPLTEEEIHQNHFTFFEEAYRLLKPRGVLTYYSDEIKDFSEEHKNRLTKAGFKEIDKTICYVTPPEGCRYWKSDTIVAPIIRK